MVVSSGSVAVAVAAKRNLREELGLDFLLEGALQRLGERLRVTVKLVDAASGVVCWTSHFDYEHSDLFHVQQDVAALVAAGLEPEIPIIAAERMKRAGAGAEGAYEIILQAISRIHLLDRRSFMEAGELLHRAIDIEPEYSPAYSWLALWHVFLVGQGWARDARASTARAGEVAEHAVMLDPNDARGLAIAGHVRAFLHRRLDEALPLHERALEINPSLPLAWHLSGVAQAYQGNLEEARRRIEQCRRLAPRDPHSFFADGAAVIVELLSRNHAAAAVIGRRVTQLHPRFSAAYKPYLSALGHLGESKEAALVYRRLLQLEPDFTVRAFRASSPFALREHTDHYAAGLSLAGVP
jgi:tetratricopeptide (TPR) repeat protein